ncbi:NAD(P)/FAD-dependent oxidoreductase [Acrocarpospora macrocephala]|uniref:FAD-dependent oxidoreductase n=1 Tax=Acrocarpospora macrocephala TaxID=150177 RepID=A0A5M3X5Z2_9ACTN|nr:NAD(P)/FAD-dependent oxidoreductase [Acrocarpospora macrocephala]GES16022.1 FAD-dependent oxidoreductase [Acrocarpospora macrocephala]
MSDSQNPSSVVEGWLGRFATALAHPADQAVSGLFLPIGWWRDLAGVTWDLRSSHGSDAIDESAQRLGGVALSNLRVDDSAPMGTADFAGSPLVSAFFTGETPDRVIRGHVRLVRSGDGWRAWTLVTQIHGLPGVTESAGRDRPMGIEHGEVPQRVPWTRRSAESSFDDADPEVVIIGAGQAGLSLAARFKAFGVTALVVERHDRIGDNWRKRYPSLTLHDPVWVNRLPYLDYPATWPVFMPKEKFGDWLEMYARALDLNVWTGVTDTTVTRRATGRWEVRLTRPGAEVRTLRPRHVVLAVGLNGKPRLPAFPGRDAYSGVLVHSDAFTGGREWAGRNAVVVGAGTSAHDIAHDLCEHGATVTLVQRSSTVVVTSDTFMTGMAGLYDESGPAVDDADLLTAFPWNLLLELQEQNMKTWQERDAPIIDALAATAYRSDYGPSGRGPMEKYLAGTNGYYIDVGALRLIADGKIAVRQGVGIARLGERSVIFDDGTELPADVVVAATGYEELLEASRSIIGDLADEVTAVHRLDADGELAAVWRPSGVDGLWFMVGNIQMARFYSRVLALQIAARSLGIADRS